LANAEGGAYIAATNFIPYNPNTVITGNPSPWFNPNMFHMQPMVPCPNNAALTCGTLGDASRGILRLTIKSVRAEGEQLMVAVSDTGVGLPQQADHIFKAFFTTTLDGTGMGLRINRSIVESHGGRLWAAGNSPSGASFYFTLPARIEAPQ
jgi:nitrogen-specific signal transduction histidine kinase